ncbi:hypothetical protein D8674_026722 [Pyrus ussuriensis x Pyrus communis]|uniref:Uncharacterized protein n=1 Tax=Pyrus ussuriensis x Pyrus communis TaxID=2448454 RepID=A0A5N5I8P3_9ROSA|nr:hypothetical protein D8674_026722 [Pyrus ussuriensis x Pyrus communis]
MWKWIRDGALNGLFVFGMTGIRADCHGIEGRRHDMFWMGHARGWIGLLRNRHVAGFLQASGWRIGNGLRSDGSRSGLRH